uniref:Major facilitator superfamily (MFS) profile domain-containing protein n=1 Tax=Sexangularia sp. CB-2014 TaxID=1486929 RepID=A0A7S1VCL0_9EUKA
MDLRQVLIILASFSIHFCVIGSFFSFGQFFQPLRDAFDASSGAVGLVAGLHTGIFTGSSSITGKFVDSTSPTISATLGAILYAGGCIMASQADSLTALAVWYGAVAGFGGSLAFIPAIVSVSIFPPARRGTALGIAVSGSGAGNFGVAALLGSVLIPKLGWRGALATQGGAAGVVILLSALAMPKIKKKKKAAGDVKEDGKAEAVERLWDFMKTRTYLLILAANTVAAIGLLGVFTHVVPLAEDFDIAPESTVWIVPAMGISSMVGRIVLGYVGDAFGHVKVLQGSAALCAGMCAALPFVAKSGSVPGLFSVATLYSLGAGAYIATLPAFASYMFPPALMGRLMGTLYAASGVGNVLSSPVMGLLRDRWSYVPSFLVAAGFLLLGLLFLLPVQEQTPYESPSSRVSDEVFFVASPGGPVVQGDAVLGAVEDVVVASPRRRTVRIRRRGERRRHRSRVRRANMNA